MWLRKHWEEMNELSGGWQRAEVPPSPQFLCGVGDGVEGYEFGLGVIGLGFLSLLLCALFVQYLTVSTKY